MNKNLRVAIDELKTEIKSLKFNDKMTNIDIQCNLARMQEMLSHINRVKSLEREIVAEYYAEISRRTGISPWQFGATYAFYYGTKSND